MTVMTLTAADVLARTDWAAEAGVTTVIVVDADAAAIGQAQHVLREAGVRSAAFVGDPQEDGAAIDEMAGELFAERTQGR